VLSTQLPHLLACHAEFMHARGFRQAAWLQRLPTPTREELRLAALQQRRDVFCAARRANSVSVPIDAAAATAAQAGAAQAAAVSGGAAGAEVIKLAAGEPAAAAAAAAAAVVTPAVQLLLEEPVALEGAVCTPSLPARRPAAVPALNLSAVIGVQQELPQQQLQLLRRACCSSPGGLERGDWAVLSALLTGGRDRAVQAAAVEAATCDHLAGALPSPCPGNSSNSSNGSSSSSPTKSLWRGSPAGATPTCKQGRGKGCTGFTCCRVLVSAGGHDVGAANGRRRGSSSCSNNGLPLRRLRDSAELGISSCEGIDWDDLDLLDPQQQQQHSEQQQSGSQCQLLFCAATAARMRMPRLMSGMQDARGGVSLPGGSSRAVHAEQPSPRPLGCPLLHSLPELRISYALPSARRRSGGGSGGAPVPRSPRATPRSAPARGRCGGCPACAAAFVNATATAVAASTSTGGHQRAPSPR
jgi:hypothetical protein